MPRASVQTGTRIGPYEIIAPLGIGGMGEVYRARDLKLGREVAIKILPQAVALDAERLARFDREARLLATLNHPNIGAIYGVESLPAGGGNGAPAPALILELIEGPTLADHILAMPAGQARIREALDIARQIAEALDAAHERGVVHRDLKPANIKLTPDGLVKVLDFGLAKSQPDASSAELANSPTVTVEGTRDGVILGTAAYMSPEQARGRAVDRRTDVWSFGCVLYEMLVGERPFKGDTTSDLIATILERQPDLSRLPEATPPTIVRLLRRCLEKDVKKRLRDIGDARADLDEPSPPATAPVPGTPRSKLLPIAVAVAALAFVAGAAADRYRAMRATPAELPEFDRIVRIVATPAHEYAPALSPDSKWIAYLSDARGVTDVWVKFLAGGDPANLTASSGLEVQSTDYLSGVDVSPDGSQIALTVIGTGQRAASWVIPAPLGGVARPILSNGNYGMQWSPDGKRIVFVRAGGPLGDALVVADPDGQNELVIAKRQGAQHIHWPRWSGDGKYVYFNHGPQNFNIEPTEIYRVPVGGGPIESVVATARRAAYPFLSRDGQGMIFAANPDTVDLNLWWRDLRSGKQRRLTSGIGEYTHPYLSADGKLLAGTVFDNVQALDRVDVVPDKPAVIHPLTDTYAGATDPVWSSDGSRLIFSSSRSGSRNLWFVKRVGDPPTPLTTGNAFDERAAISPDGQRVAFVSDRGGHRGIWIVPFEGGTPRLVTTIDVVDTVSWSPDGTRLVFSTPLGDAPGLMIVNVENGSTTRLATPAAATGPTWSRDDVIAYIEPRGGSVGAFAQLIKPDGTPAPSEKLDGEGAPQIANGALSWSPDGKRLAAASLPGAGTGRIWIIDPANPAPYKKLLDLPAGVFVRGLAWSHDGRSLVFGRYRWSGDIFLAERSAPR